MGVQLVECIGQLIAIYACMIMVISVGWGHSSHKMFGVCEVVASKAPEVFYSGLM